MARLKGKKMSKLERTRMRSLILFSAKSQAEIAREMDCRDETVRWWMRKLSRPTRRPVPEQEIVAAFRAGWPKDKIAKMSHVSTRTVDRITDGLKRQSPPKRPPRPEVVQRILFLKTEGWSTEKIARKLHLSEAQVVSTFQRFDANEHTQVITQQMHRERGRLNLGNLSAPAWGWRSNDHL